MTKRMGSDTCAWYASWFVTGLMMLAWIGAIAGVIYIFVTVV